jgi:ATP-dependent Clp endopeptidase proteolytic subunit ClpP
MGGVLMGTVFESLLYTDSGAARTQEELVKLKTAGEIYKLAVDIEVAKKTEEVTALTIVKTEHEVAYQLRQRAEAEALDKVNGVFTFYDTVNKDSVKEAISSLGQWSRRHPDGSLKLVLSTPGGSILDGLALFDYVRFLRETHYVETVALGTAASMGSVLLQAGEKRSIGKHSFMLIHEATSGSVGKSSELEDHLEFMTKLQEKVLDIYAERSTMTAQKIKNKWKNKDWWLSSDECLSLGFVDAIC